MRSGRRRCFVLGFLVLACHAPGPSVAVADDPPPRETPDQRFEKLYSAAMKAPEKADWKALRRAFAETSRYRPYEMDVPEKLRGIAAQIGRGEFKEGEAALRELLERERHMRLDTLAMAMRLYEKMGRPEEVRRYRKLIDPILGILFDKESGASFEKPIPVLFIQEEYVVTSRMRVKERGLVIHDGHRFDVCTVEAEGTEPERKIYFDVDLPQKALSKALDDKLK
jgi:hypothetical protein